jgi:hypothetical protein
MTLHNYSNSLFIARVSLHSPVVDRAHPGPCYRHSQSICSYNGLVVALPSLLVFGINPVLCLVLCWTAIALKGAIHKAPDILNTVDLVDCSCIELQSLIG